MSKTWKLYILRCGDGTLYTGITVDVPGRFAAHCNGTGAKYTKGRGPLTLVYEETCPGKGEALRRELQLKNLSLDGGQVAVDGTVTSLHYEEPRQTAVWAKRLFG
jgi:predicted GIY-YIG superfamily endonuclease